MRFLRRKAGAKAATALLSVFLLLAAPVYAAEVNLYTDRQEVFLRPLALAFEEESGIKVNVLFVKKGMFERIKAEGNKSPMDVVMALDIGKLRDIAAAGLIVQVDDDVLNKVPDDYRDPDGYWFGITRRIRAIFAPKGSGIKTYEQLAERDGICLRSGKHLYNISLIADMIGRHGADKAKQWLRGVKANLARRPQGNDRAQIRGVLNGECKVGIANSYYYFQMLRKDNPEAPRLLAEVEMIIPQKPSVNVSGIALGKHAPNRDNALKLMRFLVGARAQNLYASENFEFPVSDDAVFPPELEPYRSRLIDAAAPTDTALHRVDASIMVENIGFDR